MNGRQLGVVRWVRTIEAEFLEIPGLNLSKLQMQRLWGLDAFICDALVDALVAARVLRPTDIGTYIALSRDVRSNA